MTAIKGTKQPKRTSTRQKKQAIPSASDTQLPAVIEDVDIAKEVNASPSHWNAETELVGIVLKLSPYQSGTLPLQYTVGLHAWLLDQVRQSDPNLSAYLHDGQSEKPFTISQLEGEIISQGRELQLSETQIYRWQITGLSKSVVQWLDGWLDNLPTRVELRQLPLKILDWEISGSPTTYQALLATPSPHKTLSLSFITPTSFRRKKHHFPLPVPFNLFHSYLRRWNDFSGMPFDQDTFLAWVDEGVIIHQHRLESVKVAAGKQGMVTGFTGHVELGLSETAQQNREFTQLFYALGKLAPYCGTGHKTTFGLGQTRWGWHDLEIAEVPMLQVQLARRIEQLTDDLMALQKRTGGERALKVCQTRATILARREFGESLQDIADDLQMPYETVKTYVKLARAALKAQ